MTERLGFAFNSNHLSLTLSEFNDYANVSRDFHLSSSYWVCLAISMQF